jgi:hypothetical protein
MATGRWHGVWWPPNPGWCRKLGAIRSFLLSRSTYDGLGEENATGAKWAPTRASTVPPERRGGGRDPGRPPSASRARPHHASSRTKPQTTASLSLSISFPAQSLVSRSKYRLACVHHNSIPPIIIFCFVMAGGAAATVNNNTTYFGTTWIFSRPK